MSIGFHLFGIGIRGQIALDWFILVIGLFQRFFILFVYVHNSKKWSFHELGEAILFLLVILFYLALMYKHKSMEKSIFRLEEMENKLTKKNFWYLQSFQLVLFILAFCPIIEKMIFNQVFGYLCDSQFLINSMYSSPPNSTIFKVFTGILCFNEYISSQQIEASCSLYMVAFLVFHFVKMKHIDLITSSHSSRWRDEILNASSDIFSLHEQFEDALSFILFFKVASDFTYAFLHIFMFADFNSVSKYIPSYGAFIYASYKMLRQAMFTILLFLFISWLQEKVETRCNCLRHHVLRKLFINRIANDNILDDLLFNVLSKKVSMWKMLDVSRSTLLTLASVNVAFPVLFAQIENGALNGGRDG